MKKAAIFMPLAAGACWGASGIFVRTLRAADFNNITIMFSRAIVGFVLLFVFLMIHDRSLLRIRLCDLPVFLSAAINGYLLMNTCYNLTVESLTLSLASVLLPHAVMYATMDAANNTASIFFFISFSPFLFVNNSSCIILS